MSIYQPHLFAAYAADLLESLRKLAAAHNQTILAHLLALAAIEARTLAKTANEERSSAA
jgi:hypothetical protein